MKQPKGIYEARYRKTVVSHRFLLAK